MSGRGLPIQFAEKANDSGSGRRTLVDARDEAARGAAVVLILLAECFGERGFFNVDAIEKRGDGENEQDGQLTQLRS